MRELVAHDHANATGVHFGRVGAVEEWWLEDACGEVHLVGRGVVVRVHGWRRHVPMRLIRRLPDLIQSARMIVDNCGLHGFGEGLGGVDGRVSSTR